MPTADSKFQALERHVFVSALEFALSFAGLFSENFVCAVRSKSALEATANRNFFSIG